MAIDLKRTGEIGSSNLKMLVYGIAGSGKTTLATTCPNPIIISAEAGLLSIKDADLPYIQVSKIDDVYEAYSWLTETDEGKQFDTIVLDSISEIGEVCLSHEKATAKDPRAAYGNMQDLMQGIIRAFRDIPDRHILFTAKVEKQQDEMGKILYSPSMPGNKMGQALPYFFDLVMALRVEKDDEGKNQRALQCDTDGIWQAKDRSGKLDAWELPDVSDLINKISGESE